MDRQTAFIQSLLNPEELGHAVPAHVRDAARVALGEKPVETVPVKVKPLSWDYDYHGEWRAQSALHDDGISFDYKICVFDDGAFDVSESDEELGAEDVECFPTLQAAKEWCQANEATVLKAERQS